MVKKCTIMELVLRLLNRSVDSLVERNENDFNLIVQDYEKLTHEPLQNLFSSFTTTENQDILGNEETSFENEDVD